MFTPYQAPSLQPLRSQPVTTCCFSRKAPTALQGCHTGCGGGEKVTTVVLNLHPDHEALRWEKGRRQHGGGKSARRRPVAAVLWLDVDCYM